MKAVKKEYVVPFTGSYDTRISQSNSAAGVAGTWGIGVWGQFIWGGSNVASGKDERYLNCMYVAQLDGYKIIKRPGFDVQSTPASGNIGTAILIWTGQGTGDKIISAFGGTNSTIYDGTTSLGAITGKATAITETFVTTTATLCITSTDNTAWYYDVATGSATKISDADFPGNAGRTLAGTFAHMDGYAFILDTRGDLWNSDLNSVTAWTATSYLNANAYPDKGIACVRHKNQIIAFGTESMQFYYNAGNATGSPLSRIDNATIKIGAINADSIAQIGDAIFFMSSSPQGGVSLYVYDGTVQRLSTPQQDFQFTIAGPSNISLTTLRFYGRSFVLVKANAVTYVYCLDDKRWHEWSATTPLWYKMAGMSSGNQIMTYSVSKDSTSGKVYIINPTNLVFTDDGTAFTASIQTPQVDLKTMNTKFWDELRIVADVEPSSSTLTIQYTDDDYTTYTTWGTVDLSTANNRICGLGSSRRRAWKLVHSANTQFRLHRLEGIATIGNV